MENTGNEEVWSEEEKEREEFRDDNYDFFRVFSLPYL